MTDTTAAKANPTLIDALKRRKRRVEEILDGDLPTTRERLCGYPPLRGSESDDRRVFCQQVLLSGKLGEDAEFVPLIQHARDDGSDVSIVSALAVFEQFADFTDISTRLRLILAASGHTDSLADVSDAVEKTIKGSFRTSVVDHVYADAMLAGLDKCGHIEGYEFSKIIDEGLGVLRRDAARINSVDLAIEHIEKTQEDALSDDRPSDDAIDDLVALALEDRAECVGTGIVVVPKLDARSATAGRKDIVKSYEAIAARPLPKLMPTSVDVSCAALQFAYPHFHDQIDRIFRLPQPLRLLLVGSPGCGKTSLARDLAEEFHVPSVVYAAGGSADSSFAGTSAQWSSARASVPLQLIHRSQIANPFVVLDEIEKAGTGRHNGSLVDSLLSFLEPSSAARILDPALEVEVDLSAVNYIATANSIDDVPAALRDRFKIIRMPDPEWKHLGDLVWGIIDSVAVERDLDHRWIEQFAPDEFELIRKVWPGGSLRKLRRIVELIIDGRERLAPRS